MSSGPKACCAQPCLLSLELPEGNPPFLQFHFRSIAPQVPKRDVCFDAAADSMQRIWCSHPYDRCYRKALRRITGQAGRAFRRAPLFARRQTLCWRLWFDCALLRKSRPRSEIVIVNASTSYIRLFQWVERMNRPESDFGEFKNQHTDYSPDDDIPATLISPLKHIAIDFVPETRAPRRIKSIDRRPSRVALVPRPNAWSGTQRLTCRELPSKRGGNPIDSSYCNACPGRICPARRSIPRGCTSDADRMRHGRNFRNQAIA